MKIHVGEIVSEILLKQRLSKTEFANKLHYSKQNINTLLKRDSWNSDTILRACEILNDNVFQTIANLISSKKENTSPPSKKTTLDKKEIEALKKEIAYLKEINHLLKKK
jgi:plasmid maintenance system antidote protein VapI